MARETTFTNSIEVVKKLEKYAADGHLKPTTKFITADVKNLYTVIPREEGRLAFIRFLRKYSKRGKIGTLSIDHIWKLARLVLETNCFVYNNKYYIQVRGGAMGSAFTQVYANIYMLEWEQELIQHQAEHNEIYGRFVHPSLDKLYSILLHRYIDDLFMTNNQTTEEINLVLGVAQNKDVNIEIETNMSSSVNYLDVTITTENGQLRTKIYHKPTAEPYYLPYTSDHPHRYHRNIPYSALMRAARLCSHVEDFNQERLRIEMSLLLSDYPPTVITNQFLRFFQVHRAEHLLKQVDQEAYHQLHQRVLYQTTSKSKKPERPLEDLMTKPAVLEKQIYDRSVMYIRYPFESGPKSQFHRAFLSWWKEHYQKPGSPGNNVKVRLIPKTNVSLENFLIRKKPSRAMLTRMEPSNN